MGRKRIRRFGEEIARWQRLGTRHLRLGETRPSLPFEVGSQAGEHFIGGDRLDRAFVELAIAALHLVMPSLFGVGIGRTIELLE
jgi:hypothetical protein